MRVFCKDVKESNEDLILRCKNVNQIWDTVKFFFKILMYRGKQLK